MVQRRGDLTLGEPDGSPRWEIPQMFFAPSSEGEEPPDVQLSRAVDRGDPVGCRRAPIPTPGARNSARRWSK